MYHIFLGGERMKLYVLFNEKTGNVVAISEEESYIPRYMMQQNYGNKYSMSTIKKEKIINKYLIVFEEYMLEEIEDYVMTLKERRVVYNILDEETYRLESVISDLKKILSTYEFKKKESIIIKCAIKLLDKISRPSKLMKYLDIKGLIKSLFNNGRKNIVNYFEDTDFITNDDRFYIHININDD